MSRLTHISFETIDPQPISTLFEKLTVEFSLFAREKKHTNRHYEKLARCLKEVVFKQTGIQASFKIIRSSDINAASSYPMLDKNHMVWIEELDRDIKRTARIGTTPGKKETLYGYVDLKRSRVSGVFSKIPVQVTFFSSLLINAWITPEEAAAIILHELGHIFTYFEYLGKTLSTNYVLDHVARQLVDTRDPVMGYQLINEACKSLDIVIDNPKDVACLKNYNTIYTIFLQATVKKRQYELNSSHYDHSSAEMLADQFATRHGAGKHLAIVMNKIKEIYQVRIFYPPALFLFINTMKAIAIYFIFPLGTLVFLFVLLANLSSKRKYDEPKPRFERMRRDLMDQLKDRTLSREASQTLIENVEGIDYALSEIHNNRPLADLFIDHVFRHNQMQQLAFQQKLEKLVNNDLFYHAARFKVAS